MKFLDQEKRFNIFMDAGLKCEVCGDKLTEGTAQLAHRINQSKRNLKKYGKAIIHHKLNLATTCSKCNNKVSLYGKYNSIDRLVENIKKELKLLDIYNDTY